jgi:hypothetical protein
MVASVERMRGRDPKMPRHQRQTAVGSVQGRVSAGTKDLDASIWVCLNGCINLESHSLEKEEERLVVSERKDCYPKKLLHSL